MSQRTLLRTDQPRRLRGTVCDPQERTAGRRIDRLRRNGTFGALGSSSPPSCAGTWTRHGAAGKGRAARIASGDGRFRFVAERPRPGIPGRLAKGLLTFSSFWLYSFLSDPLLCRQLRSPLRRRTRPTAFAPEGGALPPAISLGSRPVRRFSMYTKPEITKHEDLSQVTFSSH